ncbi:MAG: ABC transporter permease [Pseudomonadales bacterium]|nr:ABC transporter permease [Pseudomonadales bacterium]
MTTEPQLLPFAQLLVVLVPVAVVIGILFQWSLQGLNALYSVGRMALQLALVGFVLTTIFSSDNPWVVVLVLTIMVVAASWIALGSVTEQRKALYLRALLSIGICGGAVLWLVVGLVLRPQSLLAPEIVIPLGGMIFAGAMNSISLAAERYQTERQNGQAPQQARNVAMQTAMIPVVNSMFAVGLVSLPGMMTGQILSGVSPLVAVRYQVVVMCMLFGASGLATAMFLQWVMQVDGATSSAKPSEKST